MLPLEPQLDGILSEHAVNGEMAADIAQEIYVVEAVEPVGIVGHQGFAAAEGEELGKYRADAGKVLRDVLVAQQPPTFVLAGRVADPRSAATHQGDWPMSGLLEPVQQHDLDEAAHMERRGGAIKSDIGRDWPFARQGIKRF